MAGEDAPYSQRRHVLLTTAAGMRLWIAVGLLQLQQLQTAFTLCPTGQIFSSCLSQEFSETAVFSSLGVALAFPDAAEKIFAITGATAVAAVCYLIPVALHLMQRRQAHTEVRVRHQHKGCVCRHRSQTTK